MAITMTEAAARHVQRSLEGRGKGEGIRLGVHHRLLGPGLCAGVRRRSGERGSGVRELRRQGDHRPEEPGPASMAQLDCPQALAEASSSFAPTCAASAAAAGSFNV